MKRVVFCVTSLLLLFSRVVADDCIPTVTACAGTFVGTTVITREGRNVSAFLGVPYAKPPVGDLRFEPPQPLEPLNTTYDATSHASVCVQYSLGGSEDCLYLDVYTPIVNFSCLPKLLPVFVFIHGGSFEFGSAVGYTPEYLLDEDVLVVVLQYRLGFLGFLSTGDKVVPGNMGLKDQRCALRWIQENIASFGGDPDKVTIAGESAGAISVHYLMLFAADEGLFRAGISQSGNALDPSCFKPPNEVRNMVRLLSELTLCPSDSYGLVECLRHLPAAYLAALYADEYKNLMYPGLQSFASQTIPLIGAVLEPECASDRLITANPWERNVSLPWLAGVNSKEGLLSFQLELVDPTGILFASADADFDTYYPEAIFYQSSSANGSLVSQYVKQFYLNNDSISLQTINSTADTFSDPFFMYTLYEATKRANRSQIFLYMFDYIGCNQLFLIPSDARVGASHSEELFFFFPHPSLSVPIRLYNTTEETQLSKILVKLWIQFVTYLEPTPSNDESCVGVTWKPFNNSENFLYISKEGFSLNSSFLPERMNFWLNQPFPFRDDSYEEQPCTTNCTGTNTTLAEETVTIVFNIIESIYSIFKSITSYIFYLINKND